MATKRTPNTSENPVVLTVKIRANGDVAEVIRADGKVLTKPTGQMPRKPLPLKESKLTDVYSYHLFKFVDEDGIRLIFHPWICIWYEAGTLPALRRDVRPG
jgi:hypothetical protein